METHRLPRCQTSLESIRNLHGHVQEHASSWLFGNTIQQLFKLIEKVPVSEIPLIGSRFSSNQLLLFANHLSLAPDSNTLFKIAVLFFHFLPKRFESAVQHFCYMGPEDRQTIPFFTWVQMKPECLGNLRGWIKNWFSRKIGDSLESFIIKGLLEREIHWRDFESQAPNQQVPLLLGVVDQIFEKGLGTLITKMPVEMVHTQARRFLNTQQDLKLVHFFTFFSPEKWEIDLVQEVYQTWGAPDPLSSECYRLFTKGVLWSFRQKFFQNSLPLLQIAQMRKIFWMNWVHHCTDIMVEKEKIHFHFGKLAIMETQDYSLVHFSGQQSDEIRINFDPSWETKMNEIMNEHLY